DGAAGEAEIADFLAGGVIDVAKHLGDFEGGGAVMAEEAEEGIAADEIGLRGLKHFGGDFVGLFGERAGEADDFASVGDAEDDGLAVGGGAVEFYLAGAEDENAAGLLAFDEE